MVGVPLVVSRLEVAMTNNFNTIFAAVFYSGSSRRLAVADDKDDVGDSLSTS